MTGYGRATVDGQGAGHSSARMVVEIRSVNHRGFDLKIRSDQPDGFCDAEITRTIRAAVDRGTVTVGIRDERAADGGLDLARIRQTQSLLDSLRRELGLPDPVDLRTVAAYLTGGSSATAPARGEDMWRVLQPAVDNALAELIGTREREGAALQADLSARLGRFSALVGEIAVAVQPVPARHARRLEERLAALRDLPGFDPGRSAQEIALMAERLDVTEELVRLRTHLDHFGALLAADVPVGRKLDFVIQEMGREINTIGSKAQDAAVAGQVIDGKAELEKIREQAQNIE